MRQFAEWLTGARHRAILATVLFAVLPFLEVASVATVALATIRRGEQEGLLVAAVAAIAFAGVQFALIGGLDVFTIAFVLTWFAVIALAALYRRWRSLSLCLQVLTLGIVLLVLLVFLLAGDPGPVFQPFVETQLTAWRQLGVEIHADTADELALWAPGLLGGGLLLLAALGLLIGVWWNDLLISESFTQRFAVVKLGLVVGVVAAVVFLLSGVTGWVLLENLVIVLMLAFLFQGLAVLHALRAHGRLGRGWLVGTYVLLLLPTPLVLPMAVGLAGFGFIDNWLDLRKHLQGA